MGTWKFLDAVLLDVHQWSAVFSPNLCCQRSELFPLYWKEGSSALKETGVSNKFFSEDMALLCSAQH